MTRQSQAREEEERRKRKMRWKGFVEMLLGIEAMRTKEPSRNPEFNTRGTGPEHNVTKNVLLQVKAIVLGASL